MARQTIIWTALPNGISETSEGKFLSLSVYVSIRLYNSNDQLLALNQYSDFLTWSERVKGDVQFGIDFGNGVQVPSTDVRFQNGQIEPELWTALFTAATQVKPYKFEKPEPSYIQSYPVKNIETFLREEYADIAVQWPERFPDATWLQQRLTKVQFFQYEPKSPIATGLRQNLRQRTPALNRQQTMQRLGGLNQGLSKALSRHIDGILKHSSMMLKAESGDVIKSIVSDVQKYGAVKNGAPEPSRDFLQLALFHTPQNAPETDPQKAKINPIKRLPLAIPQLDFHEAISSLGDYPGLQRKLGLVLDLLVPVPQGIPQTSRVKVKPTWQKKLSAQTVDFTPKTVYEYGPSLFRAKTRGDADLRNGLLDVSNANAFDVVQLDIDGGAIKLMNTAATIEQMDLPEEPPKPILLADAGNGGLGKVLSMTNLLNAAENIVQAISVPSLRSSGLSVVRSNRPLQLISMLNLSGKYNASVKIAEQNPALLTQPALPASQAEKAEVILYAEDIVRGYRVDVWDSVTQKWHSLCKRKGTFTFERVSGLARDILEEGMVGMGVTSAADGSTDELRLHEALFRWEGWSLVSTMPGKVINEEDNPVPFTNESKTPYGLQTNTVPQPQSLPRLRFGTRYRLRVRAADLGGKGLLLEDFADNDFSGATEEKTYVRFEPISSPALLLRAPVKPGESLEHAVIRSNYDKTPVEYAELHSLKEYPAERHVVAPRISIRMAEMHGMFDGMTPEQSYNLITSHDSPFQPSSAGQEGSEPKDVVITEETVELPYLPDPIAAGASLVFSDRHGKQVGEVFLPQFYPHAESWPDAKSFILRLVEGTEPPQWQKDGQRILTVPIAKAEYLKLRLSCYMADASLGVMGIWNWVKGRGGSAVGVLEPVALQGRHWMLTPSREIVLLHAVQQPLSEPGIKSYAAIKSLGATAAILHGKITLDAKSTTKIDVRAEWEEPLDDLAMPGPKTINGKAQVFDAPIDEDENLFAFGDPNTPPQVAAESSMPSGQPDVATIVTSQAPKKAQAIPKKAEKKSVKIDPNIPDLLLSWPEQKHEFGDTRYRKVHYHVVATTRFREQFLDLISPPSASRAMGMHKTDGEPDSPKEHPAILPEGDKRESSEPETEPNASVLPLTRESSVEVTVLNSARPHTPSVRYIIPTFKWERMEDEKNIISRRCGGGLRVYMDRPWYSSGDEEILGVVLSRMAKGHEEGSPLTPYVTKWGLDPIWNSPGSIKHIPSPADFKFAIKYRSAVSLDELPDGEKVRVVGHAVEYDSDRRLWYSDVVIDAGSSYYPFVRLALTRFQPNSLPDAEISRVVMTDFVQLVPDRAAAVTAESNGKLTVQVAGIFALNRSKPLAAPADLLESQYFVASLERRVAEGDLGWVPVNTTGTDQMVPTKVYGNKMLWVKELTPPEQFKKGTKQYRVVLKEYELFDAEEEKPVPRLVYADAIEL